jgi:hypothetical protein
MKLADVEGSCFLFDFRPGKQSLAAMAVGVLLIVTGIVVSLLWIQDVLRDRRLT